MDAALSVAANDGCSENSSLTGRITLDREPFPLFQRIDLIVDLLVPNVSLVAWRFLYWLESLHP